MGLFAASPFDLNVEYFNSALTFRQETQNEPKDCVVVFKDTHRRIHPNSYDRYWFIDENGSEVMIDNYNLFIEGRLDDYRWCILEMDVSDKMLMWPSANKWYVATPDGESGSFDNFVEAEKFAENYAMDYNLFTYKPPKDQSVSSTEVCGDNKVWKYSCSCAGFKGEITLESRQAIDTSSCVCRGGLEHCDSTNSCETVSDCKRITDCVRLAAAVTNMEMSEDGRDCDCKEGYTLNKETGECDLIEESDPFKEFFKNNKTLIVIAGVVLAGGAALG